MNLPRPAVWAVRCLLLVGVAIVLGNSLRTSGRYLGHAPQFPEGFQDSLVVGGLHRSSSVSIAPDGRVFLVMQDGTVRIVENDTLLPEPFVQLDVFNSPGGGLFHLTFDSDFATNGYIYLYYVAPDPRRARLLRVTAQGNRALLESFFTVWESPPLTPNLNHYGGSPIFDDNAYLYFGTGDATDYQNATADSPATPFGKIMRVTRDGAPAPNNPFVSVPGALPQVFALGFRNPYNLARDPVTGTILVNDVGENTTEEINRLVPGGNYGWDTCEGDCTPPRADMQNPIVSYPHGLGADTGCAIVGGVFYHPARVQFPDNYLDNYFYADLCSGWMRTLDLKTNAVTVFARGLTHVQDLDVAPDGSLYYLTRGLAPDIYAATNPGQLWRITYQPN